MAAAWRLGRVWPRDSSRRGAVLNRSIVPLCPAKRHAGASIHRTCDYKIGTMIEIPRACVVADKIAEERGGIILQQFDIDVVLFLGL